MFALIVLKLPFLSSSLLSQQLTTNPHPNPLPWGRLNTNISQSPTPLEMRFLSNLLLSPTNPHLVPGWEGGGDLHWLLHYREVLNVTNFKYEKCDMTSEKINNNKRLGDRVK